MEIMRDAVDATDVSLFIYLFIFLFIQIWGMEHQIYHI